MQIVIDIPDEDAKFLMESSFIPVGYFDLVHKALHEGTVLPKGHGDLIDRDELEPNCVWDVSYNCYTAYGGWQVEDATVVIPADKEDDDAETDGSRD